MARVRPFAAYRYASTQRDITPLVAPPYDVISDAQRADLLTRNEHNAAALELPEGALDPSAPGNRYDTGGSRWREWRERGVVVRDSLPAIYVLEQQYTLGNRDVQRRAFIAEVELHAFEEGIVLAHERTLPKALGDRLNLIRATAANTSAVFGLFADAERVTDALFESAMVAAPLATATDDDGVVSTVWAVDDPEASAAITAALAVRQIFIADGHHRYTTALAYRDERRAQAASATTSPVDPPYDFVMMALANMGDPDLVVLPTHRVADAPGCFDAGAFWTALSTRFAIEELPPGHPGEALDTIEEPAFLVQARGESRPRVVRLRADIDLDTAIPLDHSAQWKRLDVAVLQELILNPILGIHPDRPETFGRLSFVKDAHDALKMTDKHDVAFVMRPTRMDQLRAIALAGETMPQKSTYFYPKLLSGLLYRAMDED